MILVTQTKKKKNWNKLIWFDGDDNRMHKTPTIRIECQIKYINRRILWMFLTDEFMCDDSKNYRPAKTWSNTNQPSAHDKFITIFSIHSAWFDLVQRKFCLSAIWFAMHIVRCKEIQCLNVYDCNNYLFSDFDFSQFTTPFLTLVFVPFICLFYVRSFVLFFFNSSFGFAIIICAVFVSMCVCFVDVWSETRLSFHSDANMFSLTFFLNFVDTISLLPYIINCTGKKYTCGMLEALRSRATKLCTKTTRFYEYMNCAVCTQQSISQSTFISIIPSIRNTAIALVRQFNRFFLKSSKISLQSNEL